jgi:oligopeptide transport system substrate-binding protein
LTAYDFDYAWNRVVNNKGNVPYDWMFNEAHIKTWTALDASTFQVTLYEPTSYFVGMTAFYTFFPVKESVVDDSWDGMWSLNHETAVPNGPFKLKSFRTGGKII